MHNLKYRHKGKIGYIYRNPIKAIGFLRLQKNPIECK